MSAADALAAADALILAADLEDPIATVKAYERAAAEKHAEDELRRRLHEGGLW
ncbi:hypothetical protein [Microbispora sp. ATCC PTA-5024]|uniref:hypothetical protein n=1 Tax=Microbispora sp. ATCC PTA-5024 TaxID=316330 RepID=UPI0003DD85BB|nr:hypothetical protein [Microbispora sp. ATCC PTA-5024]ETK36179.1 hypothetical protein MPTA5024_11170 [Microbispora sp. ATCC PTA-5024]